MHPVQRCIWHIRTRCSGHDKNAREPSVIRNRAVTPGAPECRPCPEYPASVLVPGGEVESPCLAAAVFETATSTDSVTPARDAAARETLLREARIIRQTRPSHNLQNRARSGPCKPAANRECPLRDFDWLSGNGAPALRYQRLV